jgi:hypothetical protein
MDTPTLPEPDKLERIVTLVDSAMAGRGWHATHMLIKIEETPDASGFDLGMKELETDEHPVEALWGFEAPDSWSAIGVVTYGWASPWDAPEGRASKHPDRVRARVTSIVDRGGREAATTVLEDGTVIDHPGISLLGDVLRRCVGAPTAPPPPVQAFADLMWLREVVEVARQGPMSWRRAELLRVPADSTWPRLRARAEGYALWMDDGMFARWLFERLPPIESLLAEVDATMPPKLARRLRAEVAASMAAMRQTI